MNWLEPRPPRLGAACDRNASSGSGTDAVNDMSAQYDTAFVTVEVLHRKWHCCCELSTAAPFYKSNRRRHQQPCEVMKVEVLGKQNKAEFYIRMCSVPVSSDTKLSG